VSPVLAADERPRLADLAGVASRTVHAIEAAKPTVQLDKLLDVLAALGLHLELARGARREVVAGSEAKAQP
jgi:hypothetical protein